MPQGPQGPGWSWNFLSLCCSAAKSHTHTHTHARMHAHTHTHTHEHTRTVTVTATPVGAENFVHGPETVFLLSTGNPDPPKGLSLVLSHSPSRPEIHLNTYPELYKSPCPFPALCHHLPTPKPHPPAGCVPAGISWSLFVLLSLPIPLTPHPCSDNCTH